VNFGQTHKRNNNLSFLAELSDSLKHTNSIDIKECRVFEVKNDVSNLVLKGSFDLQDSFGFGL
jgi:hypothetical protein